MKYVAEKYADLIIDGKPFRLETLAEMQVLEKLIGMRGVRFVTKDKTKERLKSIKPDPAERRRIREAVLAQMKATEFPAELIEILPSRKPYRR